ncbi:hypothetical protein SVIOM342S_02384 [Streptomyces violaceorubidus]
MIALPAPAGLLRGRVTAIDRAGRTVRCADGSVTAYDTLVLATGSNAVLPPRAGCSPGRRAARGRARVPDDGRLPGAVQGGAAGGEGRGRRRRAARCVRRPCAGRARRPGRPGPAVRAADERQLDPGGLRAGAAAPGGPRRRGPHREPGTGRAQRRRSGAVRGDGRRVRPRRRPGGARVRYGRGSGSPGRRDSTSARASSSTTSCAPRTRTSAPSATAPSTRDACTGWPRPPSNRRRCWPSCSPTTAPPATPAPAR